MLVLRMVADGMLVINNIKSGFYSFYVRQNVRGGFLVTAPYIVNILSDNFRLPPAASSQY